MLVAHFTKEETDFIRELPRHKREIERNEHQRLARPVNALMEKHEADPKDRRGQSLHRSLREMIINHIRNYDRPLMGIGLKVANGGR